MMNLTELMYTWINMIRDPVDRFVSLFFYTRKQQHCSNKPRDQWCGKDINQCIISGDSECKYFNLQVTFFCGSSAECKRINSTSALQKGKLGYVS